MTEESSHAAPATKRQRTEEVEEVLEEEVYSLCCCRKWQEVESRVLANPALALTKDPKGATPLALACRAGAPVSCIKALLDAAPWHVRLLIPSRGTPLHEAVICELVDLETVRLLLDADEKIVDGSPRATLMQDVDGHTPLHLLIRRRSPGHILEEDNSEWMAFFELLVESCPEAAGVPDRGEYEEPPLVMALKAHLYAATSADDDELLYPRYEMRIHEMVNIMLKHYPQAASQTLEGARGQYTALHSAVFHGRCSDTIQLLLQAEAETVSVENPKATLLANTQGEIPLHFAAMRGEPPRSIGLLGNAAPMAVQKRDTSGLTPLHWLWIRFVGTILSLDDRQLTGTVDLEPKAVEEDDDCPYSKYWHVERGDFSQDLILIRKYDPPLDFFRMRHIPPELYDNREGNLSWAERPAELLAVMRERDGESLNEAAEWTRAEVVSSLFWVKVVSLLKAYAKTQHDPVGTFHLVHTAMSSPCCPPPVAHITSLLFPDELTVRDSDGRFPLHHATLREWQPFDWKNDENDTAALKLLEGESLELVKNAIAVSPPGVFRVVDNAGRLPLNYLIESFVGACSRCRIMSPSHTATVASMLDTLKEIIQRHPEALERRDGETKLYPFLQATAAAASPPPASFSEEMPLSIVYMLLRENPLLVASSAV